MSDVRPLDSQDRADRALCARHYAALDLLRRGVDQDGELMLSYVIWPTGWLERISSGSSPAAARPRVRQPVAAARG